ncbi:D-alanine--D-alanine ligase family protein [Rhodococcus sp. MEB064]|uniref:D-alanine--D-alanine ligase family protein n=1 Tax=Rhodococcus sp. MEB064 TaxID=1587522 RepID=UPI000A94941E|nr:D-alanine--D-alanine ligase [Rhodococcus sp. MEB064]
MTDTTTPDTSGTLAILHLVGSAVDDFHSDLSRVYARDALSSLADPARYTMHIALVSSDSTWRFPADLSDAAVAAADAMSVSRALDHIADLGIDAVVPQMFCLPGMTSYRALFDVLRIPLLGNRADVMALAADKARTRAIVAAAGVDVPEGVVVTARSDGGSPLPLPVVVKPVDADNSVGVALARTADDYAAALEDAGRHSERVLVETYIDLGREVRCGIVVVDGQVVCLPLEEYAVDATSKPIRTRDDKLARDDDGELYLVAKNATRAWIVAEDDPVTERVWEMARIAHRALGCRHYSLFDFRIDPDGRPWFLEAGLYCSYARGSVVAVMAAAAGIGLPDLFASGLKELAEEGER